MKLKIYALIAAAAMSWCGATHADEVSVTFSEYEYQLAAPTSNTVSFPVDLFDSSLGQLKSVELLLEVTANSSAPMRGRTFLSLVDPTVKVTDVTDSNGWETIFFIPPTGSGGVLPSQFFIEMYKWIDDSDPVSLALFERDGPTSALGLFSLFNVEDTPDSRISLADFNFTVFYTYLDVTPDVSAVPVPASAWLMGTGVLAMGAFLRRRRGDRNALAF